MAIPRVFVASTCYDLKYIRGNLQYFVRSLGYEPVLSEAGDVFYNPKKHTHDSCVSEVTTCQLFVLIIGGRFGGLYKESDKSITNAEYEQAVAHHIPVFTLVEQAVYAEHHVYVKNRDKGKIDARAITYPAADSTKIFDFIDDVRKASFNNAIQPFQDFADIESYLRKQWAGLVFSFLSRQAEEDRVADVMGHIARIGDKIEFLSQQILKSVGSEETTVLVSLYDIMMGSESIRLLLGTGHKPTPVDILKHESLEECAKAIGKPVVSKETEERMSWSSSGEINSKSIDRFREDYKNVRSGLLTAVKKSGIKLETLLKGQSGK